MSENATNMRKLMENVNSLLNEYIYDNDDEDDYYAGKSEEGDYTSNPDCESCHGTDIDKNGNVCIPCNGGTGYEDLDENFFSQDDDPMPYPHAITQKGKQDYADWQKRQEPKRNAAIDKELGLDEDEDKMPYPHAITSKGKQEYADWKEREDKRHRDSIDGDLGIDEIAHPGLDSYDDNFDNDEWIDTSEVNPSYIGHHHGDDEEDTGHYDIDPMIPRGVHHGHDDDTYGDMMPSMDEPHADDVAGYHPSGHKRTYKDRQGNKYYLSQNESKQHSLKKI